MSNQIVEFLWAVEKDGYRWVEAIGWPMGSKPGSHLGSVSGMFLVPAVLSGPMYRKKLYAPLRRYTGLYRTFAALPSQPEGILSFANKYGLLGQDGLLYDIERVIPQSPPAGDDSSGTSPTVGIPLAAWQHEINVMQWAIKLWNASRNRDDDTVYDACFIVMRERTRLEKFSIISPDIAIARHPLTYSPEVDTEELFSDGVYINTREGDINTSERDDIAEDDDPGYDPGRKASDFIYGNVGQQDEVFQIGMSNLRRLINVKLASGVSPKLHWERNRSRLGIYLTPQDLLAAMWLQMALAVDGDKNYRQCPECQNWFEVSPSTARSDKVFCSTACRVRAYRRRKDAPQSTGKPI